MALNVYLAELRENREASGRTNDPPRSTGRSVCH
jgi:hypothetical protein